MRFGTFNLISVLLPSNQDATIYVGGLDEKVSDSLLWELFVQAGPVVNVHMPKDRVTMLHQVSDDMWTGEFRRCMESQSVTVTSVKVTQ